MVGVEVAGHEAAIAALAELLPHSAVHRDWPRDGVERCLHAPIRCDQYLLLFGAGRPVGFLSWAWLSPEAEAGYLEGSRLLRPGDFRKTSPADVLWIIDLIAPFGHVLQLCRLAQRVLSPIAPVARIRRGDRRQGFFPARRAEG